MIIDYNKIIHDNTIYNTMEWMLSHSGIAVAKIIGNNNNNIEIIKYSENKNDYEALKLYAKNNGYTVVSGIKEKGDKLGYLRE